MLKTLKGLLASMETNKLRKLAQQLRSWQKQRSVEHLQKTAAAITALTGLKILRRKVFGHVG